MQPHDDGHGGRNGEARNGEARNGEARNGEARNGEARNGDTFGVLRLVLHPGGYDRAFVPEPGKAFADVGGAACR